MCFTSSSLLHNPSLPTFTTIDIKVVKVINLITLTDKNTLTDKILWPTLSRCRRHHIKFDKQRQYNYFHNIVADFLCSNFGEGGDKFLTKGFIAVLENFTKIIEKVWGTGRRPFREPLRWFEISSKKPVHEHRFICFLRCSQLGFELFQSVRLFKLTTLICNWYNISMESINLQDVLDAGVYHPPTMHKNDGV